MLLPSRLLPPAPPSLLPLMARSTVPATPYTDGGRAAVNDIYAGGARIDKRDVFTDGARLGQRDVFTDGSRIGPRDVFTDGARGI